MIEISHQQAQRLLRSHLDARLPNEQWMTLQAHLENCETCRADYERLVGLEKALKRSLRAGLGNVHGPDEDTDRHVLEGLQSSARLRKRRLAAGAAAVLILLILWLGGPSGILARMAARGSNPVSEAGIPASGPTPAAEATEITYQPTVVPGQFSEVIAYEGRRDGKPNGDHEIYLLNPGSTSANLTNHPGQDTDPAWSPDGEWLAFLSDRSQKTEVFVTNITGSRVVQLTSENGIIWEGPLSWSPDGQWISLSGIRTQQGSQSWIYLVALDGTGARPLAGSRSGDTPKFSPSGIQIAYRFFSGDNEGIIVQNLQSGDQVKTQWMENPLVPSPAPGSAFDWSPDGAGLAFVSAMPNPQASADQPGWDAPPPSGAPGSQVLAVRPTYRRSEPFTFLDSSYSIDSSRWPSAFRGVSWAPGGNVVYLEDLDDARANDTPSALPQGCWTLQISGTDFTRQPNQETARQTSYGGLCVEGGIDRASWTADGHWIVVQGRLPSEDRLSIYALRMPGGVMRARRFQATPTPTNAATPGQPEQPGSAAPGTILRLSDDPWAGSLPSPRPRRSAFGYYLEIDPQPVIEAGAGAPPSDLSRTNAAGQILYVVQNRTTSVVASANPDGTGGRILLATSRLNRCPTWSPDGNSVALVQVSPPDSTGSVGAGENELFGEPPGDASPRDASSRDASSSGDQRARNQTGIENIFVLNPRTGGVRQVSQAETIPVRDLQPDQVSYGCPVWSPEGPSGEQFLAALVRDGRKTFLAVLPVSLPNPLDPAEDAPAPQARYVPIADPDWSLIPVWSTDGEKIYLLHSETDGAPPGITAVTVPTDPHSPLRSAPRLASWQTQTVTMLGILPDGKAMLRLEIYGPARAAHLHHIIFGTNGRSNEIGPAVYLERRQVAQQDEETRVLSAGVKWLYGSTFGVILRGGPQDPIKTRFYTYNINGDKVQTVAAFEDQVNSAAWSPDGRWLMFSAESGLWGVDIQAAAQGRAGPVWISPQPVQDLDWK